MLRLILFLVAAWIVVSFIVRATRFLGTRRDRRHVEAERRRHPEDYAKKAEIIDIDPSGPDPS